MRCEGDMYLETIFIIFYSYNTPIKKSQFKNLSRRGKIKMIIIIVLELDSMVNPGQSPGYSLSPKLRVGLTIINPS
jgi:hypothetical protein